LVPGGRGKQRTGGEAAPVLITTQLDVSVVSRGGGAGRRRQRTRSGSDAGGPSPSLCPPRPRAGPGALRPLPPSGRPARRPARRPNGRRRGRPRRAGGVRISAQRRNDEHGSRQCARIGARGTRRGGTALRDRAPDAHSSPSPLQPRTCRSPLTWPLQRLAATAKAARRRTAAAVAAARLSTTCSQRPRPTTRAMRPPS
jgi:hypothetical protein